MAIVSAQFEVMKSAQARPGTIAVILQSANPIFIAVAVGLPVGALSYAMNSWQT